MAPEAPPSVDELIEAGRRLGAMLRQSSRRLATAESATGGLIGHVLTQAPGSSDYFAGGVIAYANELKTALLGVTEDLLQAHGAVSAEVATAMACGALERLPADVTLAITGIAGPDGGSARKPVGLAYVAVATTESHEVVVERHVWPYDRDGNKRAAALAALTLTQRQLA